MHWSNDYNTRRIIDSIPRDELLGYILGSYEISMLRGSLSRYLGEANRLFDSDTANRWDYLQDLLIDAATFCEFQDEGKDCDYD